MQEIINGETNSVDLTIYSGGSLVDADDSVVVSVYDADDSTETLLVSGSATNEPVLGIYSYQLTPTITSLDRVLKIVWQYNINSIATNSTIFIAVVTPYARVSDIVDYYSLGTKPQDPNYKSDTEIATLERISRTIIEGYSGQKFSRRSGFQEVFGDGSDAIWLTEPMISIDQMYENSRIAIDNTISPAYNNFGFPLEITQTGKTIRIVNVDWDVRYDNNIDPTVLYYGRFRNHSRYKFVGKIGWNYVPQDIKLCATLLVGDLLANDAAWRIKYLKKISLSEIDFEMAPGAFNGTGNLLVDNILDSYRNTGIVII